MPEITTQNSAVPAPVIVCGFVFFGWQMTMSERAVEREACRAEFLDAELLDRVLEEKTLRANRR